MDALCIYVEPLVAGARVAVLGDGDQALRWGARLLEAQARSAHVYVAPSSSQTRVSFSSDLFGRVADEMPRGVSVRALRDDFDVRDGAFDLVVIPDLAALPRPSSVVSGLRRIVDPAGAVVAVGRARTGAESASIVGSAAELRPAVAEYAELYDWFALAFENVKMTGLLPFSGIVFAELGGADDVAVSVDTRLVEPDPPSAFVIVASRAARSLEPYAMVQVEPSTAEVQHVAALATATGEAVRSVASVEQDSPDARANHPASAENALAASSSSPAPVADARSAFVPTDDNDDASVTSEYPAYASGDDGAMHAGFGRLASERAAAEARAAELEQLWIQAQRLIGDLEHRLAQSEAAASRDRMRAEQAELALTESREALAASELQQRPILAEPAAPADEDISRLHQQADALALEVARREGEIIAQSWTISRLERELELARAAAEHVEAQAPDDAHRQRAWDELYAECNALRQALSQEYDARKRLEAGEELAHARAALQQQAVLLAQASAAHAACCNASSLATPVHPEGVARDGAPPLEF